MRTEQSQRTLDGVWTAQCGDTLGASAQLVMVFGGTNALQAHDTLNHLYDAYPNAHIMGCTTSGEIHNTEVADETVTATAISFEHTRLRGTSCRLDEAQTSYEAGKRLATQLLADDLAHVFVLSDGLQVNGSELVKGLGDHLPEHVAVTGGLAGDGDRFSQTCVFLNDTRGEGIVAAIGFYGDRLRIGFGSVGGWDHFGPDRLITRSEGNVLYELDGQSALDVYKRYLGPYAADLPASGLLFPLSLRMQDTASELVRTILAVDEETQSMTFAGDVPTGTYSRFMKANFDRLIDGAAKAAETTRLGGIRDSEPDLAILISCVGRKLVLKQRVEEEVESVREILGGRPALTGFYSYGEISPHTPLARCELHNQTMTVTTFAEV